MPGGREDRFAVLREHLANSGMMAASQPVEGHTERALPSPNLPLYAWEVHDGENPYSWRVVENNITITPNEEEEEGRMVEGLGVYMNSDGETIHGVRVTPTSKVVLGVTDDMRGLIIYVNGFDFTLIRNIPAEYTTGEEVNAYIMGAMNSRFTTRPPMTVVDDVVMVLRRCNGAGRHWSDDHKVHPEQYMIKGEDGKYYCKRCWEGQTNECCVCGERHLNNSTTHKSYFILGAADGETERRPMCKTCWGAWKAEVQDRTGKALIYCAECNTYHTEADGVELAGAEGLRVCPHCGNGADYKCRVCGKWLNVAYMRSVAGQAVSVDAQGHGMCWVCYKEQSHPCDVCSGRFFGSGHAIGSNRQVCRTCYEGYRNAAQVHAYNYRPAPVFHKEKEKSPVYLGVELEVKTGHEYDNETEMQRGEIVDGHEFDFYYKADSSIGCGWELVAHPRTLASHHAFPWKDVLDKMVGMGFKSHNTRTCGLHVHVSSGGMSDSHKIKFGMFIHTQQKRVEKIARRGENNWSVYKDVKGRLLDEDNGAAANDERYEAVNWQNPFTAEVRVFKGTLMIDSFYASLEFCDAVYWYTAVTPSPTIADRTKCWGAFTAYLWDNEKKYKNLLTRFDSLFT